MHLIILNGPPDTGKDTATDYLVEKYGYTKLEMKGALRRMAHAMASLALPADKVKDICDCLEFNRELKETVRVAAFGNRTWREFLIWISETVCKPIFGQDVFALAAVKAVRDCGSDRIVFSDGGFQIEVDTLYKHLGPLALVHVYRDGRTYVSDSRKYVEHPDVKDTPWVLENNFSDHIGLQGELDYLLSVFDTERHVEVWK